MSGKKKFIPKKKKKGISTRLADRGSVAVSVKAKARENRKAAIRMRTTTSIGDDIGGTFQLLYFIC